MKNNLIIGAVLALVIGGAVGFFGGMTYQKSQRPGNANGQRGQGQFGNRLGGNTTNRPVSGQIIAEDDKSITVKLMDGSSKIVILSSKTTINKASTGTKADLKNGEPVAVFGTQNSDGSLTAVSIQLGTRFGGRGPGGISPTPAK